MVGLMGLGGGLWLGPGRLIREITTTLGVGRERKGRLIRGADGLVAYVLEMGMVGVINLAMR